MSTVHIGSFSGGKGSWAAMKRVSQSVPREQIRLLFADTIIEDQDCYRLVIEGAANILGLPRPSRLIDLALALPEVSIDDPHCWERKWKLNALRWHAQRDIPGLIWIADGRHPWEVFEAERFIGNSSIDPCSKILKRRLLDAWHAKHLSPATTECYVGIDWSESHRFTGKRLGKPGLAERMLPWRFHAPLVNPPHLTQDEVLVWMESEGIAAPRQYALGAPHNNCGGFCCKAGQAHFAWLFRTWPIRYAWHEWFEERLRSILGDYSVLSDRRGGVKKPLTLALFRQRLIAKQEYDELEWGGCGCAISESE